MHRMAQYGGVVPVLAQRHCDAVVVRHDALQIAPEMHGEYSAERVRNETQVSERLAQQRIQRSLDHGARFIEGEHRDKVVRRVVARILLGKLTLERRIGGVVLLATLGERACSLVTAIARVPVRVR